MRRFDKKENIRKANLLAEQRFLRDKGVINESAQLKAGTGMLLGVDDQVRHDFRFLFANFTS